MEHLLGTVQIGSLLAGESLAFEGSDDTKETGENYKDLKEPRIECYFPSLTLLLTKLPAWIYIVYARKFLLRFRFSFLVIERTCNMPSIPVRNDKIMIRDHSSFWCKNLYIFFFIYFTFMRIISGRLFCWVHSLLVFWIYSFVSIYVKSFQIIVWSIAKILFIFVILANRGQSSQFRSNYRYHQWNGKYIIFF